MTHGQRGLPNDVTRRRFLRAASGSILGATLPELLRAESAAAAQSTGPAAKRVIVVYEQGGLSHMDTWDPKPDAPVDHRSPHRPIATSVSGIQFTALLPHTARIAHKLAVVRSMHHAVAGADAHPNGTQYALSGAHPSSLIEMPDVGSIVSRVMGTENPRLPPYIMIPGNHEQAAETRTGFLPASYKVFKTGGRDLSDPDWSVADLLARPENRADRLQQRHGLLASLDDAFLNGPGCSPQLGGMDRFYEQAFDTLTSRSVAEAFDLQAEPAAVRERYGAGHRGSCYLLARRLIEAGVRYVTVDVRWPLTDETPGGFNLNWDHHDLIYTPASCGTVRDKAGGEGRYGIGHWVMMGSTDHDGPPVQLLRKQREVFADGDAGDGGVDGCELTADFDRCFGLGIEGIQLAEAAAEDHEDDGFGFAGCGLRRGVGGPNDGRKCAPHDARGGDAEGVTTIHVEHWTRHLHLVPRRVIRPGRRSEFGGAA